jgi:hypothetical protein
MGGGLLFGRRRLIDVVGIREVGVLLIRLKGVYWLESCVLSAYVKWLGMCGGEGYGFGD